MSLNTTTIRPGLLVGLKTSITGNVSYAKTPLADTCDDYGAAVARWETERRISNIKEHEAASKIRSQARALIAGVCAKSTFGLLCPEDKTQFLEEALASAQRLISAFNSEATCSRISLYVITGRIAPDDAEAVRAINSELRDLLTTIETGIANLDVASVREAANRARSVGQMLSPAAQARVQEAIDAARGAARKIVQAGEQAVIEIDREALASVQNARTAFLDLDEAGNAVEISAPIAEARAVDFAPEHTKGKGKKSKGPKAPEPRAVEIELE